MLTRADSNCHFSNFAPIFVASGVDGQTSYTCLLQFAFVLTVGQITSHAVFLYLYISIYLYFVFVIVLTCIYTLADHFPLCGIQFAMDADFWNQSPSDLEGELSDWR